MVCSLHSVTTGSRDRANVPLIIIIIIIIMVTHAHPILLPYGNPFKCHEEVFSLKSMIPLKCFDISPLAGGCSEGLDAFRFFFKQFLKKSQNAPRSSEHPTVTGKKNVKTFSWVIGFKYKTSSWHLNGFPYGSNIGSTV